MRMMFHDCYKTPWVVAQWCGTTHTVMLPTCMRGLSNQTCIFATTGTNLQTLDHQLRAHRHHGIKMVPHTFTKSFICPLHGCSRQRRAVVGSLQPEQHRNLPNRKELVLRSTPLAIPGAYDCLQSMLSTTFAQICVRSPGT